MSNSKQLQKAAELIAYKDILDKYNPESDINKIMNSNIRLSSKLRHRYTSNFSWSFVPIDGLEFITKNCDGKILSIGSGNGWIELGLQLLGNEVVATDIQDSKWGYDSHYISIEKLDHRQALEKYCHIQILLLSWPPNNSTFAAEALEIFTGHTVIFIGEYEGCCADDRFFDILEKEWVGKLYENPQFKTIYDAIYIYTRKE